MTVLYSVPIGPGVRYLGLCRSCKGPRIQAPSDTGLANYCGYHGWCVRCYRRWRDNGKPASGPPRPRRSGGPGPWRPEEYAFLRSVPGGSLTREEAARRMRVTIRTALRYEARTRQNEEASTAA